MQEVLQLFGYVKYSAEQTNIKIEILSKFLVCFHVLLIKPILLTKLTT